MLQRAGRGEHDPQSAGSGAESELRAVARVQRAPRRGLGGARQGGGDRSARSRGGAAAHGDSRVRGAERDSDGLLHPPPAAGDAALAARSLRPRPPHLPVLRGAQSGADARSRRAAGARRRTLVGKPRLRLPRLQPPQGRAARPAKRGCGCARGRCGPRRPSRSSTPAIWNGSPVGSRSFPARSSCRQAAVRAAGRCGRRM